MALTFAEELILKLHLTIAAKLLLLAAFPASAQVPAALLISKAGVGQPVTGNLAMTSTTRPAGTTVQKIQFDMRGTDFFFNGIEQGVQRQWHPHFYQVWIILRGSGVADGRGLIIGNLYELAVSNPSFGACPQTGMIQTSLFASSLRLFPGSCIPEHIRLVDDRWYRINLEVSDSKVAKYSIAEIVGPLMGTVPLVTNMAATVVPLSGQPDSPITGTGVGIGATDHPQGAAFMLEFKSISVSWQ